MSSMAMYARFNESLLCYQTFTAGFMCCTLYMGQALLTDMLALMGVASSAV